MRDEWIHIRRGSGLATPPLRTFAAGPPATHSGVAMLSLVGAKNGPTGGKSVLTKVEMLRRLRAERIAKKSLTAGVTKVESHRHRALVEQTGAIVIVEPLEQLLHLLKMVGLVTTITATTPLARFPFILNRRENLDLDHMSHVRLRVDRAFANVARIVKHLLLHEAVAGDAAFQNFTSNSHRSCPMRMSLTASCSEGK